MFSQKKKKKKIESFFTTPFIKHLSVYMWNDLKTVVDACTTFASFPIGKPNLWIQTFEYSRVEWFTS